ncbi:Protein kinase PINOID [Camellia lanceoleosa]|uniref:Protein kinase PINOID n=1 Tax=Camellia lanceoleosa TaxID=1840588 RepID=A0ACC0F9B8_9ERIC|nr:Protein kinase PINOID [Camellia lanceoleosa]
MSSSDSCVSFSRLSFENLELKSESPETLSLKPHESSDSSWQAIRSLTFRRKVGLGFRDFSLVRQIGSDDIGRVFLCYLRRGGGGFYILKVVDKEVLAVKKKI